MIKQCCKCNVDLSDDFAIEKNGNTYCIYCLYNEEINKLIYNDTKKDKNEYEQLELNLEVK